MGENAADGTPAGDPHLRHYRSKALALNILYVLNAAFLCALCGLVSFRFSDDVFHVEPLGLRQFVVQLVFTVRQQKSDQGDQV